MFRGAKTPLIVLVVLSKNENREMLKAKSTQICFLSPDRNGPNFGGFRGLGQGIEKVALFTAVVSSLSE